MQTGPTDHLKRVHPATPVERETPDEFLQGDEGEFKFPGVRSKKKIKTKNTRVLTPENMRKHSPRLARALNNDREEFCLNYEELIHFVDQSFQNKNVRQLALEWNKEPLELSATLKGFQELVDGTVFKSRLTRLANALEKIQNDPDDTGYLTSSSGGAES